MPTAVKNVKGVRHFRTVSTIVTLGGTLTSANALAQLIPLSSIEAAKPSPKDGAGAMLAAPGAAAAAEEEQFNRRYGRYEHALDDMDVELLGSAGTATDMRESLGAGALLGFRFSNAGKRFQRYVGAKGHGPLSYLVGIDGQVQAGLGATSEQQGASAFRSTVLTPLVQPYNFGVAIRPQFRLADAMTMSLALPISLSWGRIKSKLTQTLDDGTTTDFSFEGSVIGFEVGPQLVWLIAKNSSNSYALNVGALYTMRAFTDAKGSGEREFFNYAFGNTDHVLHGFAPTVGFQLGRATAQFYIPWIYAGKGDALDGLDGWTAMLRITVDGELVKLAGD